VAVLIASDLAKDISGSPLLRGVSFKLERRDRMTIAGRNGAGKTTLLRMLSGETGVDGGELVFSKGTKVALHDQRPPREQGMSLRDYVLSGLKEPLELEAELGRLETAMAAGDEKALERYASVQARFEVAGGYHWRDGASNALHGLGFVDADMDRAIDTFSGGQLTRASLARALASRPDLLLLDEPTNHLDIASLEWLEQALIDLDAAVVLVAHDRWFLEAVGTCVLEVEAGRTRFFKGTWHNWRREQAAREMALGKAIEKQQAEIERMERFVERFRAKATKAKQAQSRVKALNKIERIERDPRDTRELGFSFKPPERSGRVIFELDEARLEVPGKVLLDQATLWLERGEHVSLVGPNGTGKTTLLEALTGHRPLDGGRLRSGHNVKVGYLSQHSESLEKDGARTVLEATIKQTGLPPGQARALLGKFLFSGETVEKDLKILSGGERQRVSLAILVQSGSNVLILDEPTNHLDIESREALEDALTDFPGSLLLVSHDRALLDAVGSRTVSVEDYKLRSYDGGYPNTRGRWPSARPRASSRRRCRPPRPEGRLGASATRTPATPTAGRSRRPTGPRGPAGSTGPPPRRPPRSRRRPRRPAVTPGRTAPRPGPRARPRTGSSSSASSRVPSRRPRPPWPPSRRSWRAPRRGPPRTRRRSRRPATPPPSARSSRPTPSSRRSRKPRRPRSER